MSSYTDDDLVYAAEVRRGEPQFVAGDLHELRLMEGDLWGGEQCDNCGNSTYQIQGMSVVCTSDPDVEAGLRQDWQSEVANGDTLLGLAEWRHQRPEPVFTGCGTHWPIRLLEVRKVAMP